MPRFLYRLDTKLRAEAKGFHVLFLTQAYVYQGNLGMLSALSSFRSPAHNLGAMEKIKTSFPCATLISPGPYSLSPDAEIPAAHIVLMIPFPVARSGKVD